MKFNLNAKELLAEFMSFDVNSGLRFGQYIMNKYCEGSDPEVFYEKNNGVAYKTILLRIYNQNVEDLEYTS